MAEEAAGRLYVVATPIGNLEDITLRALRVLKESDGILAEDTRHTRVLLERHGIATSMTSLHAHNEEERIEETLARLRAGETLALVTDAGTPSVSDPGVRLVRAARDAGLAVEVIPGASAVLTALVGSGLPTDAFTFLGFPPRKQGALETWCEGVLASEHTTVFFESPRRVVDTLATLAARSPAREAVVARELTKKFEEHVRGTLRQVHDVLAAREEVLGEVTVVIAPRGWKEEAGAVALPAYDADAEIARMRREGKGDKEMAKEIAKATGRKKSDVYAELIKKKSR